MKWFKFTWFSSKEREEILKTQEDLKQEIVDIKSKIIKDKAEDLGSDKPYKKLLFTGDTLLITLNNADTISKTPVSIDLINKIRNAKTEDEVIKLLQYQENKVSEEEEIKEERNLIKKHSNVLLSHPDFDQIGDFIYFKNVRIPVPDVILSSFIELIEKLNALKYGDAEKQDLEEQYEALKMFWLKLALNPLEQSRNDLLLFIKKNDVKITKSGNLILYRRIVNIAKKDNGLVKFVSTNYFKVKNVWKKSPKVFFVYSKGNKHFISRDKNKDAQFGKFQGSLYDLYKNPVANDQNVFTSWHNKGKHTIRVGQVYQIKDTEINLNNGLCAAGGLHAACVNYNYNGFGDTPVVVLVSPSKAITVPVNEWGKLRTTEMFIVCVNNKPHGVHYDEGNLDLFDDEYNKFTIGELEQSIANKSFEAISIKENIPEVTIKDIKTISEILKQKLIKV